MKDIAKRSVNNIKNTLTKIGQTPKGTVSALSVQLKSKKTRVIINMLGVASYSAGIAFISFFLISHFRKYIESLDYTADVARSIFSTTAAIGMLVFIVSAIVGGSISDDIRSRWGNRLPMILGGAFFAGIVYLISPYLLTYNNAPILLPILYGLIRMGNGFAIAPQQALLSELFTREQRGWGGLVIAAMGTVGTLMGMLVLDNLTEQYILMWGVTGLGLILFATITFLLTPKTNPAFEPDSTFQDLLKTPQYLLKLGSGDMWKMFIVQMIWGTALYSITLHFKNFLDSNIFNYDLAESNLVILIMGSVGAVVGIPIGITIQKLGKIKSSILGTGIYATFVILLTQQFTWNTNFIYILSIMGGIGAMFITTLTIALPADLVPKGKEGQFMGIYIFANGLPRALFLLIGSDWDYVQLFWAVGILLLLSIILLLGIQYEDMVDAEYKKFYGRYLRFKGIMFETLEKAIDNIEHTVNSATGFLSSRNDKF